MLLEVDDRTLNLINVYGPSKDFQRRDFFLDLSRFLSDSNDNIMGGDFNCIFNSRLDKLGGDGHSTVSPLRSRLFDSHHGFRKN